MRGDSRGAGWLVASQEGLSSVQELNFHNRRGNCWLDEWLSASQIGLCCTEWVSLTVLISWSTEGWRTCYLCRSWEHVVPCVTRAGFLPFRTRAASELFGLIFEKTAPTIKTPKKRQKLQPSDKHAEPETWRVDGITIPVIVRGGPQGCETSRLPYFL
jgi:hypothetical protein